MLTKIINLGLLFLVGFLFTGCVKWQNGIAEQDIEDVQKRSKVSIYIDNEATLKAEKDFLNLTKDLFKKGFMSERTYTFKNKNLNKSKKIIDLKGDKRDTLEWCSTYNNKFDCKVVYPIDNYYIMKYKTINNEIELKYKKKFYKHDFIVKDRELVSTKKYSNKYDIIKDFYYISTGLQRSNIALELGKKTGFQLFLLNGKELENNKLVLTPLTKKYSYKDEIERVFKEFGYKIAKNKEQSDITIETEVITFAEVLAIKNTERSANLFTMSRANGNISQLAMDVSSFSGNSSGASAAIGLAVFALDIFGSSNKSKYIIHNTISSIYMTKDNDPAKVSIFKPTPRRFFSVGNLDEQYYRWKGKGNNNGELGRSAESFVEFLETGTRLHYKDKVLKKAQIHEDGLVKLD